MVMEKFKAWLENLEERHFNHYKDIILPYLGLDSEQGLSQPVSAMDAEDLKQKLENLNEFAKLPTEIQSKVLTAIDTQQVATIGDLIRLIVSF